jgi:hypothetical protein
MGLRLSLGVSPLRASVPLTRRRRKRTIGVLAVIAVISALTGCASQGPGPSVPPSVTTTAATTPAAITPTPTPTPTPSPTPTRAPTTHAAAPPPPPPSCHPLTNGGNCYEPGEFCRHSDEGATGLAGDGEKIKCEDNDGWRWEPI